VVAAILFLATSILTLPSTLEDAQITFRYALRASEGYPLGFWNQQGPSVSGFTSLLWTLLLIPISKAWESDAVAAMALGAKLVSIGVILGFMFFAYRFAARAQDLRERGLAYGLVSSSLVIGLTAPIGWYATSGMETVAFSVIVLLCVVAPRVNPARLGLMSLLGISAVLLRPEGVLFACVGLFQPGPMRSRRDISILARGNLPVLVSLAAFVAYVAYQVSQFGYPMPNTVYAKSGDGLFDPMYLFWGAVYWAQVAKQYPLALAVVSLSALLLLLLRRRFAPRDRILIAKIILTSAIFVLAIARSGGDNASAFPYLRHFLILLPSLALLVGYAVSYLSAIWRRSLLVTAVFVVAFGQLASTHLPWGEYERPSLTQRLTTHSTAFDWLDRNFGEYRPTMATSMAGQLPLYLDNFRFLDMLGLNDEFIAHNGVPDEISPVDSKTAVNFILDQRPDLIEGYVNPEAVADGSVLEAAYGNFRGRMIGDLFCSQEFRDNYVLLPIPGWERATFARKDFLRHTGYAVSRALTLEHLGPCQSGRQRPFGDWLGSRVAALVP